MSIPLSKQFAANVNAVGQEGKTPLHMAACGILKQVRRSLSCLLHHLFTSSLWFSGPQSLLLQEPGPGKPEDVIQNNQMDIVRLLVAHDADFNAEDDSGGLLFGWCSECAEGTSVSVAVEIVPLVVKIHC